MQPGGSLPCGYDLARTLDSMEMSANERQQAMVQLALPDDHSSGLEPDPRLASMLNEVFPGGIAVGDLPVEGLLGGQPAAAGEH